jgi:phosphopantetheine--protein transferase-like protein
MNVHRRWSSEVFIVAADSREGLRAKAEHLRQFLATSRSDSAVDLAYSLNCPLPATAVSRLAIVASSPEDLDHKLAHALERLADPAVRRIKERTGVYYFEDRLHDAGTLAFLFPGEGAQYVNMLADLCLHFPQVRAWFDLIDQAFAHHERNLLPSQVIFPPSAGSNAGDDERIWRMDCGAEAVFTANQALFTLLSLLEIRPQAVVGHSTGDYSALHAAGVVQVDGQTELIEQVLALNSIYNEMAQAGEIPAASLVAVGAPNREDVASLVERSNGALAIAMDNCPHQIVLSGPSEAMEAATAELGTHGAICTPLPFSRAYHTPAFERFCDRLGDLFREVALVPPSVLVYSCATAKLYPDDPDAMRKLASEQWAMPVRFRETIEAMYEAGTRIFVEVGPRGNLCGFVDDILRGKSFLAVPANVVHHSGIDQINHLVGLLAAHGVPMRLEALYEHRRPERLSLAPPDAAALEATHGKRLMTLALGLPILDVDADDRLNSDRAAHAVVSAPRPASGEVPAAAGTSIEPVEVRPDGVPHMPTVPPATLVPQQGGVFTQVMEEYLQTMDQFLAVQQGVMQAFLAGAPVTNHGVPAETAPVPTMSMSVPASFPLAVPRHASAPSAVVGAPSEVVRSDAVPSTSANGHIELAEPTGVALRARDEIPQILLRLVSERTGYPTEVLDLTLDLEADLGIDSIKRIEILGALQRETNLFQTQDMERVSSLKTLQQIIDVLAQAREEGDENSAYPSSSNGAAVPTELPQPLSSTSITFPPFPFLGSVTSFTPGQELVSYRDIDLDEDLFLHHHTLGRTVSGVDDQLTALPVVPLTISMEMVAEAAAALVPGQLIIGMRNIRAHRWIALDRSSVTVRLTARAIESSPHEVQVRIDEVFGSAEANTVADGPILEGSVVFGDRYPDPPPVSAVPLQAERASTWSPNHLYAEGMFHGPSFQGVVSVDRWGEDGTEATLKVLATEHFFRSHPNPHFLIDPVLLDAAGQLVGFWAMERLERVPNAFPYRVEALHIYGPNLPAGEHAQCRARVAMIGETLTRSDIDVIGPDGRLFAQLVGWEDRLFDVPQRFDHLVFNVRDTVVSTAWSAPVARFEMPEAVSCCLLDGISPELLEAHEQIWQKALAHLILSRRERDEWQNLKGPARRRHEWLLGRVAAKDAVRLFLKDRHTMDVYPADVEITRGEHGQPLLRGPWADALDRPPVISLAHANGTAVAIVGDGDRCTGIGIDVECLGRVGAGFETAAFTASERDLLASLHASGQEEWLLRLWCSKEAVAKATGLGLAGEPSGLNVQSADSDSGMVQVALSGTFAERLPHLADQSINVFTGRDRGLVFASTLLTGAC